MIDTELDDAMADLLQAAVGQGGGGLLASYIHPVGEAADLWRAPAMTRLCARGLFEFRELPVSHYTLTAAGWAAAHQATQREREK